MNHDNIRVLIPKENTLTMDDIKAAFRASGISILKQTPVQIKDDTPTCQCIDMKLPSDIKPSRQQCHALSSTLSMDLFYTHPPKQHSSIQLAAFDMDSTVIQIEVIDELARAHGVYDKVSRVTESVLKGDIEFKEAFKKRIQLLKGLSAKHLPAIGLNIPYTPGAHALFSALKAKQITTLLVSGGFNYFAEIVKEKLEIDFVYANSLDIFDNKITGKINSQIVCADEKASFLKKTCYEKGIPLIQTMAIGDGANDIPMVSTAGVSWGFQAKSSLKQVTDYHIDHVGLDGLLYLLA